MTLSTGGYFARFGKLQSKWLRLGYVSFNSEGKKIEFYFTDNFLTNLVLTVQKMFSRTQKMQLLLQHLWEYLKVMIFGTDDDYRKISCRNDALY